MNQRVIVVGSGVIGLTTAVRLAEAGHRVEVVAAEPPQATTSAVAGALWGPWLVEPRGPILPWAAHSLKVLRELADQPDTGVRVATGIEVSRTKYDPPGWASLLPDRKPCASEELPSGYSHGVRYSAPLIDMPVHLDYLLTRLRAAGGTLTIQRLTSLDQASTDPQTAIVNCSGIGARHLVHDMDLVPVRGYHVVATNPGLTEFLEADTDDAADLLAIYPHSDHVILGGTAEPEVWNRDPDDAIAAAIVDRCVRLEPRLADATILEHRVGLRPTRPTIRVEAERSAIGSLIIHNYGHSGAGVSLAWGCAQEVAALLPAAVRASGCTTPPPAMNA
ncbi:D-amino-acid oxidase [Kribbella steppae]|uniref:D-amino-acid oxidase n=1 Tax=Kribbella steppae TaxID=2512223 RepID=A0A4R2HPT5_9ACTN|nr:FAD-dependent oxidoreductase [Kribbella steppae]TCO32886.1 D-amino-acid oxidase [Kribbella steppae]